MEITNIRQCVLCKKTESEHSSGGKTMCGVQLREWLNDALSVDLRCTRRKEHPGRHQGCFVVDWETDHDD